ncbi:hypothetical protein BD414DRAFT_538170 [Trametes punicea]|nr:hypothetical protein BD414DRAFT_538170 [Trametes punicea]
MDNPETLNVEIAIYGGPAVGKKTLISKLNGYRFMRPLDKQSFAFRCIPSAGVEAVPIAVVLMDASNPPAVAPPYLQAAKAVARYSCILFTKIDQVPLDTSSTCFRYLWTDRHMGFHYDIDCLSANLMDENSVHGLVTRLVDSLVPAPARVGWDLGTVGDRMLNAFLDWIASCFALPPPSRSSSTVNEELAMIATDRDVSELVRKATAWDDELKKRLRAENAWGVRVHRITRALLAKRPASSSERVSMEYARQNTSIPIPRTYLPHLSWLLMDFIDGQMLTECWHRQSVFMQFRIACTLRLYVKQLRSLKRPTVGTVDTGHVGGIFFQEEVFASLGSVRRFRQFCDMVALEGWKVITRRDAEAGTPLPPVPVMPSDWSPSFIHGDLNSSNIFLDKQGSLWLIDWDAAGFYPPHLESLAMRFVEDELNQDLMPPSWARYRQFIAGTTTAEVKEYWMHVYTAIHRFHPYAVQYVAS